MGTPTAARGTGSFSPREGRWIDDRTFGWSIIDFAGNYLILMHKNPSLPITWIWVFSIRTYPRYLR